MHNLDAFISVQQNDLTMEQRCKDLKLLMFVKHKWYGKKKYHHFSNGILQHEDTPKEVTTLPTVSTESVLQTAYIDALKCCNVMTINYLAPNAMPKIMN